MQASQVLPWQLVLVNVSLFSLIFLPNHISQLISYFQNGLMGRPKLFKGLSKHPGSRNGLFGINHEILKSQKNFWAHHWPYHLNQPSSGPESLLVDQIEFPQLVLV